MAAIVEHSNDAIFSRTMEGTITTWNQAAARIFGFRPDEIIGEPSERLAPPGHRDEFHQLLARIRRGELVQHFETERMRKNGRRLHISLTLSPIRDTHSRLIGFSTIARDITEQRRVREALEQRERELDDLFNEASLGLLWTTREGRILRANRALLDMWECKTDDGIGQSLARLYQNRAVLADLLKGLVGRETLRNYQTVMCSTRNTD